MGSHHKPGWLEPPTVNSCLERTAFATTKKYVAVLNLKHIEKKIFKFILLVYKRKARGRGGGGGGVRGRLAVQNIFYMELEKDETRVGVGRGDGTGAGGLISSLSSLLATFWQNKYCHAIRKAFARFCQLGHKVAGIMNTKKRSTQSYIKTSLNY